MKKNNVLRLLGVVSLIASIVSTSTLNGFAADKPETKKEEKKTKGVPYAGTVGSVDKAAKTITIKTKEKSRTFEITSETKISKAGKPAKLSDAIEGEEAAAYGHEEGGKHIAQSLRLGAKMETKAQPKKKTDDKKQ